MCVYTDITIFIENKKEILIVITVLISVTGDVVTCNMLNHSVVSDSWLLSVSVVHLVPFFGSEVHRAVAVV